MSTNTSLDIDAIETRLAMASPGPWRVKPSDNGSIHRGTVQVEENGRMIEVIAECYCGASEGHGLRNAELIAHAPDDIKALIEEVKRLRQDQTVARMAANMFVEVWDRVGTTSSTRNESFLLSAIKDDNEFRHAVEKTIRWGMDEGFINENGEDLSYEKFKDLMAKSDFFYAQVLGR